VEASQNIDIVQFLQITSELEYELELHKQRLVNEGQDYNTIDAFRLIDLSGQGAVNQQEIFDFLLGNFVNYKFSQHELDLFMIRFDKYDKQKIKYSEFCSAFAPQETNA
jgi:Ca2+-binding EF-hand superfamily protein